VCLRERECVCGYICGCSGCTWGCKGVNVGGSPCVCESVCVCLRVGVMGTCGRVNVGDSLCVCERVCVRACVCQKESMITCVGTCVGVHVCGSLRV